MPIYQRGGTYQVAIGSGKDRWRRSFRTLEEAQQAERVQLLVREGVIEAPKEAQERPKRSAQGVALTNTLAAAYKLTVKDTWSGRKTSSSIKQAEHVMRLIGADTDVREITTSVIREMVDELEEAGCIGETINKKLSALSMMLKTAADEGWIETLPRIKRRKPGTHRLRWMDVDEELQALNMCETLNLLSLKDLIQVAIDTGFRRMELLDFRIRDYRNGMLNLHPDQTKTSKARSVPATDRVHEIIQRRRNNDRLFDDLSVSTLRTQWDLLRSNLGKTEDPQFVVHMLRHTCASRLAMQDKPAQFIQEWMGHATPLTTARYMHLAPGKLREGKSALEDYRKNNLPHLRAVNF
jgi:integrase